MVYSISDITWVDRGDVIFFPHALASAPVGLTCDTHYLLNIDTGLQRTHDKIEPFNDSVIHDMISVSDATINL